MAALGGLFGGGEVKKGADLPSDLRLARAAERIAVALEALVKHFGAGWATAKAGPDEGSSLGKLFGGK